MTTDTDNSQRLKTELFQCVIVAQNTRLNSMIDAIHRTMLTQFSLQAMHTLYGVRNDPEVTDSVIDLVKDAKLEHAKYAAHQKRLDALMKHLMAQLNDIAKGNTPSL